MVRPKPKIAFINSVYATGSTGTIVSRIEKECINHGYDPFVIYSRMNTIENDHVKKVYSPVGFYSDVATSLLSDSHGLHSKANTKKIIHWLDQFKPDIINLHNLHGFYINYPLLMDHLFHLDIPIVMTCHDCWTFTGYCSHYLASGCDQWKHGCNHCTIKNVYPYRLLCSNSKRNYRLKHHWFNHPTITMVTPSLWLADQLKQSCLSNPIVVIPNSIDHDLFNPNNPGQAMDLPDQPYVLAIANQWTINKGIRDLIKLYPLLNHHTLVTVGHLHGTTKVPWTHYDRLTPQQLVYLYQHASVLFNPTYEDTYPTVNLEAIGCHCPIIAYASGGAKELCVQENWIQPGDIDTVAQRINTNTFSKKLPQLSNKAMELNYVRLFDQLLKRGHSKS